jgi:hypothetical protein
MNVVVTDWRMVVGLIVALALGSLLSAVPLEAIGAGTGAHTIEPSTNRDSTLFAPPANREALGGVESDIGGLGPGTLGLLGLGFAALGGVGRVYLRAKNRRAHRQAELLARNTPVI